MFRLKKYLFILFCLLLTSCSSPELKTKSIIESPNTENYIAPINKTIDGVDYIVDQNPIGKFGGTLNLSLLGSGPKTFNFWASTDATSSQLGNLMFDSLFDTDPVTGEIIPKLAKSYEILDGGRRIIVTLRNGIKWSDGKEISSDDVVYTWKDIVFSGIEGGGFNSLCLIDGKYPEVRKLDNKRVEFKTHIVFAPFLRQLSYPIAPKHIVEKVIKGKAPDDARKDFLRFWGADSNPRDLVTSGAFRLHKYVKGERVEFVKNKNYYYVNKNGEELPYFKKLTYSLVQDKSLELFKFLAGELDSLSIRGEDVEILQKLQKKKKFHLVNLGPSSGTEFFIFNMHEEKNNPIRSWFNNKKFRAAVSHAIDRNAIVDNVLAGIGRPLFTPLSLPSIYLNKEIKGYPQDFEVSKRLLKEAGFRWNNENKLVDRNGKKVEFTILTNAENTNRQAIGVIVQDDLRKLGMKVTLRPIDFNTLIGRSDTGNWDAIIIGFTGGFFEPNNGANVWKLDGRLHMFDNKPHKARSWELEIDKIFNDGTKVVSFEERKKYYDRFQEIVYEENPIVYLSSPLRIVTYQDSLKNVSPTIYGGVLHNLVSIYKN